MAHTVYTVFTVFSNFLNLQFVFANFDFFENSTPVIRITLTMANIV